MQKENVTFRSNGDKLAGTMFLPASETPSPALIICHGALDFKENHVELCEFLVERGVAALAIDMHGHGQSEGERFHVEMREWVADIRAAIDLLETYPNVDSSRIGAFGLSSGGTAILEAALVDPRLKTLVALDATVRNSLSSSDNLAFQVLVIAGRIKRSLTKRDLRVSLVKTFEKAQPVSDHEIARKLREGWQFQRFIEGASSFPFPGAAQAFLVDTIKRVSGITIPTLVLWGEDDKLDPPESARLLFDALTCRKQLHIIPGNGHLGHLDRNRNKIFTLTANWALENLT